MLQTSLQKTLKDATDLTRQDEEIETSRSLEKISANYTNTRTGGKNVISPIMRLIGDKIHFQTFNKNCSNLQ